MVKEAEANKANDEKKKEEADIRNEAEQTIFATEKALKDLGDKVDEKDKEKATKEIEEVKEALKGDDVAKIKEAKDKLMESAMALGAKVYEQVQKEQAENEKNEESSDKKDKKDDVIDAEYEEK